MLNFSHLDDVNRVKVVLTNTSIKKDLDNQVEVQIVEPSKGRHRDISELQAPVAQDDASDDAGQ